MAHAGAQMQGVVWLLCNLQSPLHHASEYMEGLQRSAEFSMQGHTLTVTSKELVL